MKLKSYYIVLQHQCITQYYILTDVALCLGTPSHEFSVTAANGIWTATSRRGGACVCTTCPT